MAAQAHINKNQWDVVAMHLFNTKVIIYFDLSQKQFSKTLDVPLPPFFRITFDLKMEAFLQF